MTPARITPHAPDATGAPWVTPVPANQVIDRDAPDGEGPFRLVMPQKVEGPDPRNAAYNPPGTGDPNWNKSVRMVRAIEVQPVPPGIPALEPESVPAGEILVYGNILNRRTLTVDRLKSLDAVTAAYPWKNKYDETGTTTCTGVQGRLPS